MEDDKLSSSGFFSGHKCRQLFLYVILVSLGVLWLLMYTPLQDSDKLQRNGFTLKGTSDNSATALIERLDRELTALKNISALPFLEKHRSSCWVTRIPEDVQHMYKSNLFTSIIKNPFHFLTHFEQLKELLQWRKQHGQDIQYKCFPHVYIIGFPKCGTTDLFRKLTLHPQIFEGKRKEYHWWSRRRYGISTTIEGEDILQPIPLKDYVQLFDVAAEQIHSQCPNRTQDFNPCVTIDASPSTLWQPVIKDGYFKGPPNPEEMITAVIKKLLPTSKFIAILRNPIDRLFSDYFYFKREPVTKLSAEDFHNRTFEAIEKFNSCVRENDLRHCCYDGKFYSKLEVRVMIGIYHIYLKDWMSVWPRDQLLILRLEDYSKHKLYSINKIVDFVGLDPLPEKIAQVVSYQPPQNSMLSRFGNKQQMLPETRALLEEFYKPYNVMLSMLLKDDKFKWS